MTSSKLILIGFLIILGGMAIAALGIISSAKSEVGGGGAVVIGPIPIAFGTSESLAKVMWVVAILFAGLSIFLLARGWI